MPRTRGLSWSFLLMLLLVSWLASAARAEGGVACQAAPQSQATAAATRPGGEHQVKEPSASNEKCDPHFTYTPGPHDPSHWEGVCNTGHIQSPIDITHAEKVSLPPVFFNYQPAELDIFNDCNHYQIKVKFPDNAWLRVGNKRYSLTEFHFHEPGEEAVNGKRAAMVIHLVHKSPEPEPALLVVAVEVMPGKENPVIETLWEHIPESGQEQKVPGVKINAADLLPTDRDYYRFPGSLTTPLCNEGVTWYVLKKPIEMSQAQIDKYKTYYHDTARPLQPLNGRPITEPK